MTATLQQLQSRLADLRTPAPAWRWEVRRTLHQVRDLLTGELPPAGDGWLAAREAGVLRERDSLLARLADLGPRVLREPPVDVRVAVRRLLVDVDHHLQRRRDLAWDEVELELGGSE